MSITTWLGGVVLLGGISAAAGWAAWRLRSALLPAWTGAVARLGEVVLALSAVLGVSHAIGAVGRFDRVSLVVGVAVVAGGVELWVRRIVRPTDGAPMTMPAPRDPAGARALALVATAVVTAQWSSHTLAAMRRGITAADSIWYHLPRAARFAATGSITPLHYTAPEFPDTFHPAVGELVHAIPMLVFQRDAVAPLVNLGWLGLTLLAAWCIGRPFGRGYLAVAGVASLLATPLLVIEGAGNAGNDLAAAFFVLAAVAVLVQPQGGVPAVVIAGLAGGLAMGTKLTVVPIVAVLLIGVVWSAPATQRLGRAVIWVAALAPFGAYWYVRNWWEVGSPVPATHLPLFPSPRFEIVEQAGFSVADYLDDPGVLADWMVPGLNADFGWAWPVVLLVLAATAILAVLQRGSAVIQAAGLGLVAATAVYVVLPTTALGPPGRPFLFAGNVVYLEPVLLLGAALLPALAATRSPRAGLAVLGLSAVVLVAAPVTSRLSTVVAEWRTPGIVAAVAVLLAGALLTARPASAGTTLAATVGLTLLILVGGFGLAERYVTGRYEDREVFAWANDVVGADIAYAGFAGHFPLYGPGLENRVEYVGATGPNGEFRDITSCGEWRRRLRAGGYDHVVLHAERFDTDANHLPWTRTDPAATELFSSRDGTVFRFDPSVPDPGCP